MIMTTEEFLSCSGLSVQTLEFWLEQRWLIPEQTSAGMQFADVDVARARLIQDLKTDLGVNEEGIDVILHLIDQLHGLRRALAQLREEVPFDARFVFATNADLHSRVKAGTFRADLYFRINVMQIHLPPLRDRGDDVQELAALFMRELAQQLGMPAVAIDDRVRAALARHGWPGNIRELRNLVERTVILGGFPEDFDRSVDDGDDKGGQNLAEVERRHILSVLREAGGDREEAARLLGISRKTIDRKCASWQI